MTNPHRHLSRTTLARLCTLALLLLTGSLCRSACLQAESAEPPSHTDASAGAPLAPLLVIGFMGGRIKADNMIHQEAVIARHLQSRNPGVARVLTFANHDGTPALHAVLNFLDTDRDHVMSDLEKRAARVVIYGHSWGASEAVTLARTLSGLGIPVLLTIQVDSVQKLGENDRVIPPNVHEAMNFYQAEGLLSGRSVIKAGDPARTAILGNQRMHYRGSAVNCDNFPWFARTFMKPHIEIENDPRVWSRVEAMIQQQVDARTNAMPAPRPAPVPTPRAPDAIDTPLN